MLGRLPDDATPPVPRALEPGAAMTPEAYARFAELIERRIGLYLGDDKTYLVEARLHPVAEQFRIANLDELVLRLARETDADLQSAVIDAMTTHETSFFRDRKPFDTLFETVLPHLLSVRAPGQTLRIWTSACSTGQEPYSIAMGLREKLPTAARRVEIVATDVSEHALDLARRGSYNHFEVQRGLPVTLLVKYFQPEDDAYSLMPHIRSAVEFQRHNLLDPCHHLGRFDVIFCRNVLIYFDPRAKREILERLAAVVADDGYLFLGGSETVVGLTDRLQHLRTRDGVVFCRADAPRSATQLGGEHVR